MHLLFLLTKCLKVMNKQTFGSTRQQRLGFLLNNPDFSDTTFRIGRKGTFVYANRYPLIEASDVFYQMFKSNSTQKVFEIKDIEPDVFLEMLRFIYYGSPDINANNVMKLMKVADKFQLSVLKKLCLMVVASL